MKTPNLKTAGIATLCAALCMTFAVITADSYFTPLSENDFIRSLKQKFLTYNNHLPEDRVYLQFDKPFYSPGETIWFSAYVRNGATLKPSQKSDIIYVELISPKGNTEKTLTLIAAKGKAAGDFTIGADTPGGLYKIRAFTRWMKNEGEQNVFTKELQVQHVVLPRLKMNLDFTRKAFGPGDEVMAKVSLNTNENKPLAGYDIKYAVSLNGQALTGNNGVTDDEGIKIIRFKLPEKLHSSDGLLNVLIDYEGNTESISRAIPIVRGNIAFTMYPEGGDLVTGLESRVAFRALNEFGKPADVEGVVITEKGSRVASFSSFHQGMGSFAITPQPDEKYFVKIIRPEGINNRFALPDPLPRGYAMKVENTRTGEVTLHIYSTETETLSLVAQVRGKICYTAAIPAKEGGNIVVCSTADFPMGVAQFTLFDYKGIARAERLVFVNKHKQLHVSITTEKEKYLPREKIKMTVSVKDDRGMPMPANLSIAVTNDQLLSFADDKAGNLLSELLLQQDIQQKIEEPAFYFDSKQEKAGRALDYLLMTAGWRRYTWEKVMEEQLPHVMWPGEKAILSGTIRDAYSQKPLANALVKAANGMSVESDANGNFTMKDIALYEPLMLTCAMEGFSNQSQRISDYSQHIIFYMHNNRYNILDALAEDAATPLRAEERGLRVPHMIPQVAGGMPDAKIAMEPDEDMAPAPAIAMKREARQIQNNAEREAKVVGILRMDNNHMQVFEKKHLLPAGVRYYRAKQFSAPLYEKKEQVEVRTDFRHTIYWNPAVEVDKSGKKILEFYASDDITSFRVTAEGIASDGMAGRAEKVFYTQLPFAMTAKIPVEMMTEDVVSIPLTLKNNTGEALGGTLIVTAPDGLQPLAFIAAGQTIMPGKAKTIYFDYKVLHKPGTGEISFSFNTCGLSDAFTQKIKIAPKGFPATVSFSGKEMQKSYALEMRNVVNGSAKAVFTAYPNAVSDLMKGMEGILREPYGCFEQTSMSSYPNAMVLDYLKASGSNDEKTLVFATALLDKGYRRLVTFETKEKGYEWFGSNPGHEALTAYGLMQFNDMKKAGGKVDQQMIDRTAEWLMSRKDGRGGFLQNARALDNFGRAKKEITDAYIVYALSEAGYTDIRKEYEASFRYALENKDPYMLALAANTAFNLKDPAQGQRAMELLYQLQDAQGAWTGSEHSITRSTGKSLTIETTALAVMATMKATPGNSAVLNKGISSLVNSRSGYGSFGNTQGTILALKALTAYAKFSKKMQEDGTVIIFIDGKKAGEKSYKAGEKEAIVIDGLEKYLQEGRHTIEVRYKGVKEPLPYSVVVSWNTSLPETDKACAVSLQTRLASHTALTGETVRLAATLQNTGSTGLPSTMVIIGIPAGLSIQPWQLKELQEKKVFDYYEVSGNSIALYYRCMEPNATKELYFDLKAEVPGEFEAPASSAYLYYTNEFKSWSAPGRILVKKSTL